MINKLNANTPESNVIVSFESKTQFQGLDEVRDSSGIVIEDSLTYISMENNQEIILKVSLAQSTEQFSSLELRTSNPSVFNLGLQSPANAASVPLQPGKSTSVYIRSFYNGTDEPRMQTDTMHVIGHGKEGETLLRSFRIGSYKRLDINLHLVKTKLYDSQEISMFNDSELHPFKDSANKVLNAAIVNVEKLTMEEKVISYDLNENGWMDEYYYEDNGGNERIALRTFFLNMLREGVDQNQIILAYVANMDGMVKVIAKVAENAVAIPFGASVSMVGEYYFAQGRDIHNGNAREKLTPVSLEKDEVNKYTVVTFKERILATNVTGYVLSLAGYSTLGGALYYQDNPDNLVYAAPITLNASMLASQGRERFFVPVHEIGHMFGLGDAVAEASGNLMTCVTNFWDPLKTPVLQGREIPISYTSEPNCPYDAERGMASQWDTWIREPRWTI